MSNLSKTKTKTIVIAWLLSTLDWKPLYADNTNCKRLMLKLDFGPLIGHRLSSNSDRKLIKTDELVTGK